MAELEAYKFEGSVRQPVRWQVEDGDLQIDREDAYNGDTNSGPTMESESKPGVLEPTAKHL